MRSSPTLPIPALLLGVLVGCFTAGCGDRGNFTSEGMVSSTDADLLVRTEPITHPEPVSFNRDIRPILSKNCYFCHGPDKTNNKSDLRLDLREEALRMDAFVPGSPDQSEVIRRVYSQDPKVLMPPPESHKSLAGEQKDLLTRWIDEGAEYEAHWAYQPVERPPFASIDEIVSTELKCRGLQLAETASKPTLMRRVCLDVTGLPPTPEEARAFVEDASPDAYERLVNRLLSSLHYGENMAMYWLDAVRYADTVGYHGDQDREASPFRDYVIHAFNSNMRFDQFTREQLAGDLLPAPTTAQLVAAGYNRLNQLSAEGGVQDKEYIKKYQAERVRTTATAWLGSTLACAECHDHKFDPFTAKDFYSFAAFFSDILEKGAWTGNGSYQVEDVAKYLEGFGDRLLTQPGDNRDFGPVVRVSNRTFIDDPAPLEAELADREAMIEAGTESAEAEFREWLAEKKQLAQADVPSTYRVSANSEEGPFAATELDINAEHLLRINFDVQLAATNTPKDAEFGVVLEFDGGTFLLTHSKDVQEEGTKLVRLNTSGNLNDWKTHSIDVDALKLKDNPGKLKSVRLKSTLQEDGSLAFMMRTVNLDTVRYTTPLGELEAPEIALLEAYLAGSAAEDDLGNLEKNFFRHHAASQDLAELRRHRASLDEHLNGTRNSPATISATPREVKVLPRGNWMDESGETVLPSTPHFLPALATSIESNRLTRLDLAEWIVNPENPLTARTFVNRLWAQFFGTALSKAPEDLGQQGEYPVYPDLLDWLSAEFVASGWDVKHLVKTIVLSRTYRQSSQTSPTLQEIDPYNRLLARQTPRRLPAEAIRDNALAASGLLVRRIGGASAKPYQPAGYYQHLNFPRRTYTPDSGENQYRRGIYTHWQRTFLHPMLVAFDAPGRDECTVNRPQSNTPLQALTLLNDPSFVEAAKALASHLVGQYTEDAARLDHAFQRVLMREPSDTEAALLIDYLNRERERFDSGSADSEAFLSVGNYAPGGEIPNVEVAAWMSVCRAILNLHETITRY